MKSRLRSGFLICLAAACGLTILYLAARILTPSTGVVRSLFVQRNFAGTAVEEIAREINLRFIQDQADLPRTNFSVRWRGFLYLTEPASIQFFAGGNDEVHLRVDGQLLIRRSLAEGFRTVGQRLSLNAGVHEIVVEYQQFGGGMSLNIQRAIGTAAPSPFAPADLFVQPVSAWQVRVSRAATWLATALPIVWLVLVAATAIAAAPWAFSRWRATGAPAGVRNYARRVWLVTGPAALPPAVVFLMGPHTIFSTNRGEFAVVFGDVALPWLLRPALANWVVLFGAGCAIALLSERLTRAYSALLLVFGLLLWGQGNIWNPSYGVLTGREIDLAEHAGRGPYELAGWTSTLVLAVLLSARISRVAPFAALAFIGVQLAAAAIGGGERTGTDRVGWAEPPAEIFQFSRNQNVIHIVLDEFQSDLFTEILQQDRAALDRQLSGFQYFEDHAGSFPTTSFSMPAMLTGQEYRNQKPAPEFVREVFKQASLFDKASKAGYDIDAVSIVPLDSFEQWLGPEAAPNWKGARFRIRKPFVSRDDYREVSAQQLLELSLFRHVPHKTKEALTEDPDPFYRALQIRRRESPAAVRRHEAANSVAFFEHFISTMSVSRSQPVYKLIHVGVPHRPIVVDRDCRFLGMTAMSRQTYLDQARCAIKLVAAFLDRTRALGIYDSTLIIVSSDHGTDQEPLGFAGISDSLSLTPGPSTSRLPAIVGTAKALMLVKPPHRSGPLTVSEAPTSHLDFQPTMLDILGLPGGSREASMFHRDPTQPRNRSFGMYSPAVRFPKMYLDRIDELAIQGRVVDAAAWKITRTVWPPGVKLDGGDIDIGPRAANRYLGPGWSFEQKEQAGGGSFVTPVTKRAVLYGSLSTSSTEIMVRASAPSSANGLAIRVEVDGKSAPFVDGGSGETYREMKIPVPADPQRPSISHITLEFPTSGQSPYRFKLDRITLPR